MARTPQQRNKAKQTVKAVIAAATLTALIFLLPLASGVLSRGVPSWLQVLIPIILIFVLILALIWFLNKGYASWSRWTGFGDSISPHRVKPTDFQRKKTLWDWQ